MIKAYSSSEKQLQIFCPLDPFCHNIGEDMDIKNMLFKFCDNYTAKSNKNQLWPYKIIEMMIINDWLFSDKYYLK